VKFNKFAMIEPMSELSRWPVSLDVPVAWADMDALGHVNNTVYLRWFESARIAYFSRSGMMPDGKRPAIGPILARQTCDYRLALAYPDTVRVSTTVTRLGTTSFTMAFRIASEARGGAVAAEGEGIGVWVEYATGRKVALDDALRDAIAAFEASAT
jgi:acyl-CoA thioester hydrolase